MNKETLKNELQTDYSTYTTNDNYPFFHRIKFDSTNIYLTKTSFSNRIRDNGLAIYEDPLLGANYQGFYRYFPWSDIRAKEFLQFELGDISPSLGMAQLIGMYAPIKNDLKDVQYITFKGKAYFDSAYNAINNIQLTSKKMIDVDNFMKMNEIIPTGSQGKAIYGRNNYIIDGPAGTGKSTTVLQKIKLLLDHEKISNDKIHVIVKNKNIIDTFHSLTETLHLGQINMYTVENFFNDLEFTSKDLNQNIILKANNSAKKLHKDFEELKKSLSELSILNEYKSHKFEGFEKLIQSNELLYNKLSSLIESYYKHMTFKSEIEKQRHNDRVIFDTAVNNYKEQEKSKLLYEQKMSSNSFMEKVKRIFKSDDSTEKLTIENDNKLKKKIIDYFDRENKKLKDKESKQAKALEESEKKHTELLDLFKRQFYNINTFKMIFSDKIECYLVSRYIYKFSELEFPGNLHTIIIDEAQDVSAEIIEFIRLHTKNIILTGDELQNESVEGIGSWSNILFPENYAIYHLKHNFRQTYELGNMCYNYRELVLGRSIVDVYDEYFENQKGYSKAKLISIQNDEDFVKLILSKINYVKESFTKTFPIVIFYEDINSLKKFQLLCTQANVTHQTDTYQKEPFDKQVVFIDIKQIAGREFPIVIAPLNNIVDSQSTYVMLSRAKFDLTIITSMNNLADVNIQKLVRAELLNIASSNNIS